MNEFCGQLKAVTLRLSTVSTLNEMSDAMDNAAKAMCLVSTKLDPQKLNQLAKQMMMSEGKLEMNQEMMSAVLEDIGENMDDPVQQDKIYEDVLKEVGIEVSNNMVEVPKQKNIVKESKEVEKDSLEDMLNQLQKK
jgi:hypothetical protein